MHLAVRHTLQIYDPADASLCEESAIVLPVREGQAVMGETVAAYLDRVAWRFDLPTVVRVNGEFYGRAEWPTRALAVNDNVEFVSRPLGGGSGGGSTIKSIASVVALVALTAVAGPGGALGGFLTGALGSTLGAVAGAAIVGAGALAISYFLQPKSGGKTDAKDELYSFGLGGNAARPMQPIPVLNGRLRFAPDFAAPTYSEYAGDTMVDYALYAITCGRWRPEQVLIGDTPIWDYQTGFNPDYPGIELQFVEPGDQVTLYPVNVVTADELSGAELTTTYTPGYIVNAAGTQARQLLVDFVWGGGVYRRSRDRIQAASTHILVRVRPVDAAGAPTGPWSEIFGKIYTFNKQSQIRVTERIDVAPGRYEVSARRVNEPLSADGGIDGQDDVTWTALRAHIDGPQAFPRLSTLAVKGVASKKLSGVSGGQLRVIGTRILPVWRDGLFVEEPTRSIAWAALDWWRNGDYASGLSLSDTDFQAFVAYDALWTALGHTFDHRFTEVQNLDDVLETVLKAGRAFPAPVGDKLTITRDQPRGLSRMLFTENDILRDSLEIDYALSDEAWADGIVGEYVDESTWRLAEVSSAPDGVQLLKPARVQLQGIVNRTQATGVVRFMAAESQYRRISVNWTARMEGRLLKRGDLVKITAEEPETWGQSAEIMRVEDVYTLTLNPAPIWEEGANHYVEIRRRDGRPFGPVRVTRGASDAIAIVNSNDAIEVAGQQGIGLSDVTARTSTQERPWLAFSPGQPRTFPVLITEGDPDQDGEHIHLSGVLDAPEVYTTTENGVPPLLQVPDLFSGAMPAILGLSARIVQRQLTLILIAGWQPARNAVSYVAEVSYDAGVSWIRAYEGDRTTFEAVVGGSDTMRVRVAGVTPAGTRGAFYVVEVECPDLVVSNETVGLIKIDYPDLDAAIANRIQQIDGIKQQAEDAAEAAQDALTTALDRLDQVRKALAFDPAIRQQVIDPLIGDLRSDVEILTEASARNLQDVTLLRDALSTAGLEVLPDQGLVRFYAIEALRTETETTISNFSITVDALAQQIELYGSVQTGELSGVISSINTVQTQLNALQGTISNIVSTATFNAAVARLSTAESRLDAQAAEIEDRATQAAVDAQGVQLSQAIQRISASEGRILQQVTTSQTQEIDLANLPRTLAGFFDLVQRQQGALQQTVGFANESLSANIDAAGRVTAEVRVELGAFRGQATATFASLTKAVADLDEAVVTQRETFSARFGSVEASIAGEIQVRSSQFAATTSRIDAAVSRLGSAEASIVGEATTRAAADAATTSQLSGALSRIGAAEAGLVTEANTRAGADAAATTQLNAAFSRLGTAEAGISSLGQTQATDRAATASQFNGVSARFGTVENRAAALEGRASASEASVSSLSSAVTTADAALGQRIDTVTSRVGTAEASIASEATTRANTDGVLANLVNGLGASFGNISAGLTNEVNTRASADAALSSQTTDLYARSNAGTAFGRFFMEAVSAPAGVSVRLAAQASTESYGQRRNAGWYLDLLPDGSSRFIIDANTFAITANGGVTYPFTFDGQTLTIPSLRVTNSAILPGAVSQSGWNRVDGSSVEFQVNVRANGRVSIQAQFDGLPTTPKIIGQTGNLQILRNGALIRDTPISFYVSGNNENLTARTLCTSTFVVDTPGAGVHTYTIRNTGGQGPVSLKFEELAA